MNNSDLLANAIATGDKNLIIDTINKMAKIKGVTPLYFAVDLGNHELVKEILEASLVDIMEPDSNGLSAFEIAKNRNDYSLARMLMDYQFKSAKIKFWQKFSASNNKFLKIVLSNDQKELQRLLDENINHINNIDSYNQTIFHYIANANNLDMMKMLIAKSDEFDLKLHLNKVDLYGFTPLHYAVIKNNCDLIELMIGHGAKIDAKNIVGANSFHLAAGSQDVMEILLKKAVEEGINIEEFVSNAIDDGTNCFYSAAIRGENIYNLIEQLINYNIDLAEFINQPDNRGRTIFHYLAKYDNSCLDDIINAVNELNIYNIDFDSYDINGLAPIHYAVDFLSFGAVAKLISYELVDPDSPDINGQTPLHHACIKGNINMVKLLLNLGADKEIVDKNGAFPIHLAALNGNLDVLRILTDRFKELDYDQESEYSDDSLLEISFVQDIDIVDKNGQTPLHYAIKKDNDDIVQELIDIGADIYKKDNDGFNSLDFAIKFNSKKARQVLIENGLVDGIEDDEILQSIEIDDKVEIIDTAIELEDSYNNKKNEQQLYISNQILKNIRYNYVADNHTFNLASNGYVILKNNQNNAKKNEQQETISKEIKNEIKNLRVGYYNDILPNTQNTFESISQALNRVSEEDIGAPSSQVKIKKACCFSRKSLCNIM